MNDNDQSKKNEVRAAEQHLLLDHNYDGIQELDHMLPRWWLWLFFCTIVFSAWYVGYYMSGSGPSPEQELAIAMKQIEAMKPVVAEPSRAEEEAFLAAYKDPEKLKLGIEVYKGKCLACHGDKGQGVVGPNLSDDYWIHGQGTLRDLAKVISEGVPAKGMPPWGPVLSATELQNVVAFIHSLHGSNPPGGKPPQGTQQEFKD